MIDRQLRKIPRNVQTHCHQEHINPPIVAQTGRSSPRALKETEKTFPTIRRQPIAICFNPVCRVDFNMGFSLVEDLVMSSQKTAPLTHSELIEYPTPEMVTHCMLTVKAKYPHQPWRNSKPSRKRDGRAENPCGAAGQTSTRRAGAKHLAENRCIRVAIWVNLS